MDGPPLVVLSGPTASGKTAVATALAEALSLEIVSADAVQVYRGMDIGTAKPGPAERARVPHHLIDVAEPEEEYTAGRFVAEAEAAIATIRARGRIPLVAGGSVMYIRALLRGLDPLPADPAVRAALSRRYEEEGGAALHRELAAIDPASAARIHPGDRARLLRALEIVSLAGEAPSALRGCWARPGARYRVLYLALAPPRLLLGRRIEERVDAMFRAGFLDEVRRLLDRGVSPRARSMRSLGYRHAVAHLCGGAPLEETVAAMKRDTKRYAKRQMTWLRGERDVVWLEGGWREAQRLVRNFLA